MARDNSDAHCSQFYILAHFSYARRESQENRRVDVQTTKQMWIREQRPKAKVPGKGKDQEAALNLAKLAVNIDTDAGAESRYR